MHYFPSSLNKRIDQDLFFRLILHEVKTRKNNRDPLTHWYRFETMFLISWNSIIAVTLIKKLYDYLILT